MALRDRKTKPLKTTNNLPATWPPVESCQSAKDYNEQLSKLHVRLFSFVCLACAAA
jgi:hypothetical protein